MSALAFGNLEEFCPNCGEFVESLHDETGFCYTCSGVGVQPRRTPTPTKAQRLELWLQKNADIIEALMLQDRISARAAIKEIAQLEIVRCKCCDDIIPHATNGRHNFCTKRPQCKKARRFYKYLVHEKNFSKEDALTKTIEKFKQ